MTRDQLTEIESVRLWRQGFRMRRVTTRLMAKYGLEKDEAKDFAKIGRNINLGKFIPDWAQSPQLGSKNVKGITPRKPTQK